MVELATVDVGDSADKARSTRLACKVVHPQKLEAFMYSLNVFTSSLIAHATGIVHTLLLTGFLDTTVHEPMHVNGLEWQIAYCHMLV